MRLVNDVGALFLASIFVVAPQTRPTTPARFDMIVREDFFAGSVGDRTRLERAMKRCDEALAVIPDHAEALVWRGAGVFFQAGASFRGGNFGTGMAQYNQGLTEMARAVVRNGSRF